MHSILSAEKNHKVERAVSFATLIPWRLAEQKCLTHIMEEPCLKLNILTKTFCCKFPCFHGGECSDWGLQSCNKHWHLCGTFQMNMLPPSSGFTRMWWWCSRLYMKAARKTATQFQHVLSKCWYPPTLLYTHYMVSQPIQPQSEKVRIFPQFLEANSWIVIYNMWWQLLIYNSKLVIHNTA